MKVMTFLFYSPPLRFFSKAEQEPEPDAELEPSVENYRDNQTIFMCVAI